MPQGICILPSGLEPLETRADSIRFAPGGMAGETIVILGAGAVTFRKGVDLFIACARRVAEMAPKKRFRFVWIGEGMDTGA